MKFCMTSTLEKISCAATSSTFFAQRCSTGAPHQPNLEPNISASNTPLVLLGFRGSGVIGSESPPNATDTSETWDS